ncbi:hypothetical protein ACFQE7_27725 [Nonomuraea ferruginea]|uniref:hypothetical protein n=1 Tax=Nonomuraea ferruginea TaxID=46174 RepID=UPI00361D46EA
MIDGLVKGFRASNEIGDLSSSDVFELFAASLVLGDQLVSQVELTDLLLDKHTIGLDVVAIEVNGQLVWDRDDVDDVCDGAAHIEVSIHTLQAKQSEHINSTDILALGEAVKRFLQKEDLADSPKLESLSEALHHLFSTHAQTSIPTICAHVFCYYSTTEDDHR